MSGVPYNEHNINTIAQALERAGRKPKRSPRGGLSFRCTTSWHKRGDQSGGAEVWIAKDGKVATACYACHQNSALLRDVLNMIGGRAHEVRDYEPKFHYDPPPKTDEDRIRKARDIWDVSYPMP